MKPPAKYKILATICARGGSTRIPRKNIRVLNRLPLLAHTIKCAQAAKVFDRIILSSDSDEIISVGRKYGADVPFKRPARLAQSHRSRWDAVKHAVETLRLKENYCPDIIVDLSVASPLRLPSDIQSALKKLREGDQEIIISVYQQPVNPYYNMLELDARQKVTLVKKPTDKITEGQKAPTVYSMNDAIYALWTKYLGQYDRPLNFKKIGLLIMPRERSIDIDEEFDFKLAEYMLTHHNLYDQKPAI